MCFKKSVSGEINVGRIEQPRHSRLGRRATYVQRNCDHRVLRMKLGLVRTESPSAAPPPSYPLPSDQ